MTNRVDSHFTDKCWLADVKCRLDECVEYFLFICAPSRRPLPPPPTLFNRVSMSSVLNGPITLGIVIMGVAFNALTILLLSQRAHNRGRTSTLHSTLSHHHHNHHVGASSKQQSLIERTASIEPNNGGHAAAANGSGSVGVKKAVVERLRRAHSAAGSNVYVSRPRVYTFFVWLTLSDVFLLLSALLLYSVPNMLVEGKKAFMENVF